MMTLLTTLSVALR
jgi:hypothetical protein